MTIVHRFVLVALAALVLVVVAPEASGGGGTAIATCGQVVPTNAYLIQDLYCPGSDGVVVGASGITIDLKGFTLRGDRARALNGINDIAGYDRVTVKNGMVRNFSTGVLGGLIGIDADNFTVSNLVATGNLNSC